MLWGSRLHFRWSELYQCLTSLVTRGKVKRRFPAVHVFFFGKAWTVRGMLLQVTFFPGKCSISKAVRLFHCHVWLMLLICSTSPSLRPQRLHTQLTQTQTQSETHTYNNTWAIFHQLGDLFFFTLQLIFSLTWTHRHTHWPLAADSVAPSQNLVRWWKQLWRWSQSRLKPDQNSFELQLNHYDSIEIPLS